MNSEEFLRACRTIVNWQLAIGKCACISKSVVVSQSLVIAKGNWPILLSVKEFMLERRGRR